MNARSLVHCMLLTSLLLCSCTDEKRNEWEILDRLPFRAKKFGNPGSYEEGYWRQEFLIEDRLGSKNEVERLLIDKGFTTENDKDGLRAYNGKGLRFLIPDNQDRSKSKVIVWWFSDRIW